MDEQVESYLDAEDYKEQSDMQQDAYDSQSWDMAEAPFHKKGDSLYTLFQKVWAANDSSKVANLDKPELGGSDVSVRDAQYLALLALTLRHPNFAMFWRARSEIVLSTSASKKGWFTELFVSQKKYTSRSASFGGGSPEYTSRKRKWSPFGQKSQENAG